MLRFLIDNQLPIALARHLCARGLDAIHVRDCGFAQADDSAIAAYARENGLIIMTKDEDFAILSNLMGAPQVVWIRLGNCRNQQLIVAFDYCADSMSRALTQGQRIVIIA